MKIKNNIFSKILFFLMLFTVWGGTCYAQRFTPIFESTFNPNGHWYFIKFTNQGFYMYNNGVDRNVGISSATPDPSNNAFWWQPVGTADNFVLVNGNGQYLKLTGSGGNNGFYQPKEGETGAAHLCLDQFGNGTQDVWEFMNLDIASGRRHMNPQSSSISHWNDNDNGNRVIFETIPVWLEASPAPLNGVFSSETKWFMMKNVRANSFLSTADAYSDANGLKLGLNSNPTNDEGYWCFVLKEGTIDQYYIYNRASGANQVLGTKYNGSDANARSKMYEGLETENGVGKVYQIGKNGTGYWLRCLGEDGNSNWFIDDSKRTYFTVWQHATNPKNSDGNRFVLYNVDILGNGVKLVFKDNNGNLLPQQIVNYLSAEGEAVSLTPDLDTYDFNNAVFSESAFSIAESYKTLSVGYDEETHTLTFTVATDPNHIRYSSAPSATGWADDTYWFSLRNNRSNQAEQYNRTYITTSTDYVTEASNLKALAKTMPDEQGSYWCFVGDNTNGFVIQNAAYGPGFVLGINGNTVLMVPKDDIPSGYTTVFTSVENAVKDGASHAYAFRLGLTGNTHIHVTNGGFITYTHTAISSGDTGSAFQVTAFPTSTVEALPAYDVYKITTTGGSQVIYNGSREVYSNRGTSPYFILAKDATEVVQGDIQTSREIESFTVSNPDGTYMKFIDIELSFPKILHRKSYLFTRLETTADNQLPGDGYIKKGDGMIKNQFTGEDIQYTSNYNITQYVKHGVAKQLFMPTIDGNNSEVTAYQRWYDYEHETLPRTDVINIPAQRGAAALYRNGIVVGTNNSRGDILKNVSATLPNGLNDYWLAVDQSRYNDGANHASGDITEPSITMRVIYHLIDAKVMANKMNECTLGSDNWIEEHNISFPNKKLWNGSNDTKSGVDYIGLNHEFSNYWCFNGQGTGDANLEQMVDGKLIVELDQAHSTAMLRNVKILATNDAGIKGVQGFARNRFIAFQYPESRVVPENSHAVINVYMQNAAGTRFQLARIKLTFIGNAEPLLLNEVYGKNEDGSFKSLRSKEAMEATYGRAVSELTFDHNEFLTFICPTRQGGYSNENSQAYAFPLDFKQSSYAYHGAPWASRGEYIFRNAGTIGGKAFYPIDSYKDAIDNGASNPAAKEGKYFLYVDASEQPGQVMSIPIPERLCVGSRMFCYGWFNSATQISQESVGIVINIIGKLNEDDEEGEIIYSYNPGLLSTWAFNSNNQPVDKVCNAAPWRQVGFSFNIDSKMAGRYAAYEMQVMNNCYSTNGGDYTLDNFYIYVNPPKGNVDFTTPLCSDALRHVKVHTDYDMLVETSGVNVEAQDATLPVSFCFLNKEIFDEQTKDYYDVDAEGKRTLKENVDYDDPAIKLIFNTAFGDALIGERSINKEVKGHGFHNFTVPVNYESIPTYAFNDSPDDYIFKEEKDNGERRIVFKEQLYQATGDAHQWEPGKSYYLLFAPYHVGEDDVNHHEVGTHVFHISDMCCVLTTFSIMPPIEVKGDATVTSSDKVKACDNQIVTFKVDMPAMKLNDDATGVTDAVISGLNYDWWIGTSKANATHAGFLAAKLGTYASVEDARRYNHKSVNDYPNDEDVDRNVYLESALSNIRFYFPEAATLDEVSLVDYDNDTGYGVVKEHIDCVRYFLLAENHGGRKPLSLFGQTFNLKVSHAEADANNKQHFVAIPIIPEQQYGVDEKLIYCPSPQELIIEVGPTAPNMQNGFGGMTYPDHIVNVPIRIGKQQIDGVRKAAEASLVGNTLNIPLRKIIVTGSNSTELIAKDHETERFGSIFLTATDDKHYSFDTDGGEFRMRRVAQVIDIHAPKGATDDAYMKVTFTNDFTIHEGCTYTLKLPYVEDEECECEGTLVFDLKVVPEYVTWTADTGNSDWTNDRNWARADRSELNADNAAMGNVITNATSLSAATYPDNAANKTANAFVPMYFTNVLVGANETVPQLYDGIVPATQTAFISGLKNTATSDIKYDMEVTPVNAAHRTGYVYNCNYTCEPFGTYIANGLTFLPGGRMLNAERLDYHKAWVEYELDVNRWYTLSSPLQDTFAGEWYAPTGNDDDDAAKQLTPHFYDINYSESDCDRFRPAIYQRSWDSEANVNNVWMKDGSQCNAYITDDWSYVYNDVLEKYATGGFSVKVSDGHMTNKPADEKALVRLPKADVKYTYYDIDRNTGSKADDVLPAMTSRSRLWTDKFVSEASFQHTITNAVSTNNYFLVGNPFMTNLDMEKFFEMNPQFEKTYWVLSEGGQTVGVRSAYDNANNAAVPADEKWTVTNDEGDFGADVAVVAPLQGFFVKTKTVTNTATVTYTAAMQTVAEPVLKPLRGKGNMIVVDDESEDDSMDKKNDIKQIYTVNGMQMPGTTSGKPAVMSRKGIYIVDGKKIVVR